MVGDNQSPRRVEDAHHAQPVGVARQTERRLGIQPALDLVQRLKRAWSIMLGKHVRQHNHGVCESGGNAIGIVDAVGWHIWTDSRWAVDDLSAHPATQGPR